MTWAVFFLQDFLIILPVFKLKEQPVFCIFCQLFRNIRISLCANRFLRFLFLLHPDYDTHSNTIWRTTKIGIKSENSYQKKLRDLWIRGTNKHTEVFLNQKRINPCEHRGKMVPCFTIFSMPLIRRSFYCFDKSSSLFIPISFFFFCVIRISVVSVSMRPI